MKMCVRNVGARAPTDRLQESRFSLFWGVTQGNIPEERIFHLQSGGKEKSRVSGVASKLLNIP